MPNKHPWSNVHCTLWIQNDSEAKWKYLSNYTVTCTKHYQENELL